MHYSIVRNITVIALLLFIVLSVAASNIINTDNQPAIMILLFVAATLGSIVNQSSAEALPINSSFTVFEQSVFFAWKILVAIVFSLVLFYMLASQMITGNLFPEFKGLDLEYKGTIDFLNHVKVQTNEDAAKLLVWSFIAGYAEKFVPNIIQNIKGAT